MIVVNKMLLFSSDCIAICPDLSNLLHYLLRWNISQLSQAYSRSFLHCLHTSLHCYFSVHSACIHQTQLSCWVAGRASNLRSLFRQFTTASVAVDLEQTQVTVVHKLSAYKN